MYQFYSKKWNIFKNIIVFIIIQSLILNQAVFAGMLDGIQQTITKDLKDEGFIGDQYLDQIKGREAFQKEQLNQLKTIKRTIPENSKWNPFSAVSDAQEQAKNVRQINELQNNQKINVLRESSKQTLSKVSSYGRKYTKFSDGKIIWQFNGLTTDIENEKIYDKKGNLSIRNMRNMKYDDNYNLVSYESDTKDHFGNKTFTKWSGAKYWTEADQISDVRKQEGMLASYSEIRSDEVGVETKTDWYNITYYNESDQNKNESCQNKQMASYQKTEVSSASPDRIDQIETWDIEYLKREKIIELKTDDPKDIERRKRESEKYETLMTSFKEKRTTFGVATQRDWQGSYNEYNELIYYQEHSSTLGVETDKEFKNTTYDQYGRLISFTEEINSYETKTIRSRTDTVYNNLNQVVSYEETIIADDVETVIMKDQIVYNESNQVLSYHEISRNSEGFERDLIRSDIIYDLRGLVTHYVDHFIENNIEYTKERSNIKYNEYGFLYSYSETIHEQASYQAPDGETVNIDRTSYTERISTEYNGSALESAFHERHISNIGLITEVRRTSINYQGNKIISYNEKRVVQGTLNQSSLQVNNLDQFEKNSGGYLLENKSLEYGYTVEKIFYGAVYNSGKLISYTEEIKDSRNSGVTVITKRTDQKYGSNGKLTSYNEERITRSDNGDVTVYKEWRNGLYYPGGMLKSYQELTKTNLGATSLINWQASLYNPIGLIQEYEEQISEGDITSRFERSKIKYDEYDRQVYYFDQIQKDTAAVYSSQWESLGYNNVGLLNGQRTTTIQGLMTSVQERLHISYNEIGNMLSYVDLLSENASYTDSFNNFIVIDRETKTERIKTEFDDQGRPASYLEWKYNPDGLILKTEKKDMHYTVDGYLNSYLEINEISGKTFQDDLLDFSVVSGVSLAASTELNIQYTLSKQFLDGVYDAYGRLISYSEKQKDSRRGDTEVTITRTDQQYGTNNKILSYQEIKTEKTATSETSLSTYWHDVSYDSEGKLLSYQEDTVDSLGTKRVKIWEALSFNGVNLVDSFDQTVSVFEGTAVLSKNSLKRLKTSYDNLDQISQYEETQINGLNYQTSVSWSGRYMGLGLLKSQTTIETDQSYIIEINDKYRNYNAQGQLIKNVISKKESLKIGTTLNQYNNLSVEFNEQLAEIGTVSELMDTLIKETHTYRYDTQFNTYGQISSYQEEFYDAYGNKVGVLKNGIIYNASNVELSYSETKNYQLSLSVLFPSGLNYNVISHIENISFGESGLPDFVIETIKDSRKSNVVKTVQRTGIKYDKANNIKHYQEVVTEKGVDNTQVLDSYMQITKDLNYHGNGLLQSYIENTIEQISALDGVVNNVITSKEFQAEYNSANLIKSFTEISKLKNAVTVTQRDNIIYNQLGEQVLYFDTITDPFLAKSYTTWSGQHYNGYVEKMKTVLRDAGNISIDQIQTRENITYDSLGNLKTYNESITETGSYNSISINRTSLTKRQATDYNQLGQIISQTDLSTSFKGVNILNVKDLIKYSSTGQQISFFEKTINGFGQSFNYYQERDYKIDSFNNIGLAESVTEILKDERKPAVFTKIVKDQITYNSENLLDTFIETITEKGMDGTQEIDTMIVTSRTSTLYDNIGRLSSYNENISQKLSNLKDENDLTKNEIVIEKIWQADQYYTNSSLLKSYLETVIQKDQNGIITVYNQSGKSDIIYNLFDKEISFTDKQISGLGNDQISRSIFNTDLQYDQYGRLTYKQTEENFQGITKYTVKKDLVYDDDKRGGKAFGFLYSYNLYQREQSASSLEIQIDKMNKTERTFTAQNKLGQIISFSESATDYFSPVSTNWIETTLPTGIKHTDTKRNSIVYSKENQLLSYNDTFHIYGTADQSTEQVSLTMDLNEPPAKPSLSVASNVTNYLDYQTAVFMQMIEFDQYGRIKKSVEISKDSREAGIETELEKKIKEYNAAGQVLSFNQTIYQKDLLNGKQLLSQEKLSRTNIAYKENSNLLSSYHDHIVTYAGDSSILSNKRNEVEISQNFSYYLDSNGSASLYQKTLETITENYQRQHDGSWQKELETKVIKDASIFDGSVSGINYNQLGQIISYKETTINRSLLENKSLIGNVLDILNRKYDSLGLVSSYVQNTGFTGYLDSFTALKWQNAIYNSQGKITGYYQENRDAFGVVTYTTYIVPADGYDSYGRLLKYKKHDIDYIEEISDSSIKVDQLGNAVDVKSGINKELITTWEISKVNGFDDENRILSSQRTEEFKQGPVHTYSTIKTVLSYDNYSGLITSKNETVKNYNPLDLTDFYSRKDINSFDFSYDELGRQINYKNEVKFGKNEDGSNLIQDFRERTDIKYDDFNRLLRYQENVYIEKFSDIDDYAVFRKDTLYSGFADQNGYGKIIKYTNYIVQADNGAGFLEATQAVVSHIGTDYQTEPSDDLTDQYQYTKQTLITKYHKTGLSFEVEDSTGTVDIWEEVGVDEYSVKDASGNTIILKDPRPGSMGILLNKLNINQSDVNLEIIKSNIDYTNVYSPSNSITENGAINDFELLLKIHELDGSGNITGTVTEITDVEDMIFSDDGKVRGYKDSFEKDGTTYYITRSNILYNEADQGDQFESYIAEITPSYYPSSYLKRTVIEDLSGNLTVTDIFYENGNKDLDGNYNSNVKTVLSQTYKADGTLVSFEENIAGVENSYFIENKAGDLFSFSSIEKRDYNNNTLTGYEITNNSDGLPEAYIVRELNPDTKAVVGLLKTVSNINYYSATQNWQDDFDNTYQNLSGDIKDYDITKSGVTKQFRDIKYDNHTAKEAFVDGVWMAFGSNTTSMFRDSDYIYFGIETSPDLVYDRYKRTFPDRRELIYDITYQGGSLTGYKQDGITYQNITGYDQTTGQVISYDLIESGNPSYTGIVFTADGRVSGYTKEGVIFSNITYKNSVPDNEILKFDVSVNRKLYQDVYLDKKNRPVSYKIAGTSQHYANITYKTGNSLTVAKFDYSDGINNFSQVDLNNKTFMLNGEAYFNIKATDSRLHSFSKSNIEYNNFSYIGEEFNLTSYDQTSPQTVTTSLPGGPGIINGIMTESVLNDSDGSRVVSYDYTFTADLDANPFTLPQTYKVSFLENSYDPGTKEQTFTTHSSPAIDPLVLALIDFPKPPAGGKLEIANPLLKTEQIPQTPVSSELNLNLEVDFSGRLHSELADISSLIPSQETLETRLLTYQGISGEFSPEKPEYGKQDWTKELYLSKIPGGVTLLTETTQQFYNSYGQANKVITTTKTNRFSAQLNTTSKTLTTSSLREDITLTTQGYLYSYQEQLTDKTGQSKVISRLETSYDKLGNISSYKQIVQKNLLANFKLEEFNSSKEIQIKSTSNQNIKFSELENSSALEQLSNIKTEAVLEGVEILTETVSGLLYNDKQQLIDLNRESIIEKTGITQEGKEISFKEKIQTKEKYDYNIQGLLNYSFLSTVSSLTPLLLSIVVKSNIQYDKQDKEISYKIVKKEQGESKEDGVLIDTEKEIERTQTKYDSFGRVVSYKEKQISSKAKQAVIVETKNIQYGQLDHKTGYIEKTTKGVEHVETKIRKDIKYDEQGNEISWQELHNQLDLSIDSEKTIVKERLNTLIDGFGNIARSFERILALSPTSGFATSFFSGGTYPAGIVNNILFEGGKYDDMGRYIGFRQTNATAYGQLDYNGTFDNISIIERVGQTVNSLGQVSSVEEKKWDSKEKELIENIIITDILYNSQGQRISDNTSIIKTGEFFNSETKTKQQFFSKINTKTESVIYDYQTGEMLKLVETVETYKSPDLKEPSLQVKVTKDIQKQSSSGKPLILDRTIETKVDGISFTEKTSTLYKYDEKFNIQSEITNKEIIENGQVTSRLLTQTENVYDEMERVNNQLIKTEDLFANQHRAEKGKEELIRISHIKTSYYKNGLAKNIVVIDSEEGKGTGKVNSSTLTVEDQIYYTGAGTRASYRRALFKFDQENQHSGNLKPSDVQIFSEQSEFYSHNMENMILPSTPLSSMLSISLVDLLGAINPDSLNGSSIQDSDLTISATNLDVQNMFQTFGINQNMFKLSSLEDIKVKKYNIDGLSNSEINKGIKFVKYSNKVEKIITLDNKTNITRDGRGNIITQNLIHSETGKVDSYSKILSKSFDAQGRVVEEKSSYLQNGATDYTHNHKTEIKYDYAGKEESYKLKETTPDNLIREISRTNCIYDQQGRILSYEEKTNHPDIPATYYNQTEVLAYNQYNQIIRQQSSTGLNEKLNTSMKQFEYDSLGRLKKTTTKKRETDNQETLDIYSIINRDAKGRILESHSSTSYHDGSSTTFREKAIRYNEYNQKIYVEEFSSDKNDNKYHSEKSAFEYNSAGKVIKYEQNDFADSYQTNQNKITTQHIAYDSLGRKISYQTFGKNKDGHQYSELKTDIKYNDQFQIISYSAIGDNNGYKYSYKRDGIEYYQTGESKGKMKSYHETGITSDGIIYDETHQDIKYNETGQLLSENAKGTKGGKQFDDNIINEYYLTGHQYENKISKTCTKSNINTDYSETFNIEYENGNKTSFETKGSRDGKTSSSKIKQTFHLTNGLWRISQKNETGIRNGKSYSEKTYDYSYDSEGRAKSYKISANDYQKRIRKITYDSLGRKIKMEFSDSRYSGFKCGPDIVTETYSYSQEGALQKTKLLTPDYYLYFDKNGNKIGEVKETSSFIKWKEREIQKAREAAARTARRRAEAAYRKGLANSSGWVNTETGEQRLSPTQNSIINAITGGGRFNYQLTSILSRGNGGLRLLSGSLTANLTSLHRPITYPNALLGVALANIPQPKVSSFQTFLSKEMAKIRITKPVLNKADIDKTVKKAIKLTISNMALSNKIIAVIDAKIKSIISNQKMDLNFKLDSSKISNLKTEMAKGSELKSLSFFQQQSQNFHQGQLTKSGEQTFDEYGFNNMFMFAVPEPPEDNGEWVWCEYDSGGNLVTQKEITSTTSEDGTKHISVTEIHYDKNGYETDRTMYESYKGVNCNIQVETTFNKDGSTTSHVTGFEKSEKTGLMEKVDRTSISKTVRISGGFKSITETTDNLTGLKSVETNTYTGVKYSGDKMIEYNLKTEVHGQRIQGDGKIADIYIVDTIKQYGAKLDGQGRLIEYKQDVWSNKSPAKKSTNHIQVTEFDEQDRVKAQVTETWEKGKSVDGAGNEIVLDNYMVTYKSNIQYNSYGQESNYEEITYTQMAEGKVSHTDLTQDKEYHKEAGYTQINKEEKTDLNIGKMQNAFDPISNRRVEVGKSQWGIGSAKAIGAELVVNGQTKKAAKGYVWGAQNTSRKNITYNYAGKVEYFVGAKGKATRTTYDHMGLVVTENNCEAKTRKYDITYDISGREVASYAKSKQGKMSVYEFHYKEYNELGQITKQADTYRGSLARQHLSEGYETTFTYDQFGNRNQLERKELFNNSHGRTSALQVVKGVVLVVIGVLTVKFGVGAKLIAAGIAAMAASYACDKADKVEESQAQKGAAIAFATTVMTGYFANAGNTAAAVNTTSQAGMQGVTLSTATQAGKQFFQNWVMNTLSNMAQGVSFNDASKAGAIAALASVVSLSVTQAISKYSDAFASIIDQGKNQASQMGTNAVYKEIASKLIMKYAGIEIAKKHDGMEAVLLNVVFNTVINNAIDAFEGQITISSIGGFVNDAAKDLIQGSLFEGLVKGVFFEYMNDLKEEGKINEDWSEFLNQFGLEIISSIDYKKVSYEVFMSTQKVEIFQSTKDKDEIDVPFKNIKGDLEKFGASVDALIADPEENGYHKVDDYGIYHQIDPSQPGPDFIVLKQYTKNKDGNDVLYLSFFQKHLFRTTRFADEISQGLIPMTLDAYLKNDDYEEILINSTLLKEDASVCHMGGEKGNMNVKIVCDYDINGDDKLEKDSLELVYNIEDGKLDLSANNMGTINYSSPTNYIGHFVNDMLVYYFTGNVPADTRNFAVNARTATDDVSYNSKRDEIAKIIEDAKKDAKKNAEEDGDNA